MIFLFFYILVPDFLLPNLQLFLLELLIFLQHHGYRELRFLEIRVFVKEKFMFNYQFFISKETKEEATIKFFTNETDTAIAIEELLKHKINEAIEENEKVNLQIAKERSLEKNETISLSQMRKLSDEQI
jgi:hypothetical protein